MPGWDFPPLEWNQTAEKAADGAPGLVAAAVSAASEASVSACDGSLSHRTRVAIGKRSPTPVAYVRVRVSRMSPFSCEI